LIFKVQNQIGYLNQFGNDLKSQHSVDLEFGLRPGTVGLTQRPKQPTWPMPAGAAEHTRRMHSGAAADGDLGDEAVQMQWNMNEHR
jgi:hypothetical protein